MMLHPSYYDLMQVVNQNVEEGEDPVVNSRYSIVLAVSKRSRQIIDEVNGEEDPVVKDYSEVRNLKPLSKAVDELNTGLLHVIADDEDEEE